MRSGWRTQHKFALVMCENQKRTAEMHDSTAYSTIVVTVESGCSQAECIASLA